MVNLVGDGRNNLLKGTAGDDNIQGLGGNDDIRGYGGHDVLDGGDGNDSIESTSPLSVTIYGGAGRDGIEAAGRDSFLDGGSGDDFVSASGRDSVLEGGDGNDGLSSTSLIGGTVHGGLGNDNVNVNGVGGVADGGEGDDSVGVANGHGIGGNGNDRLFVRDNGWGEGGVGNDTLYFDGNNARAYGGIGNDIIYLRSGNGGLAVGGVGDDSYHVYENFNADIIENVGEGVDTAYVEDNLTYRLDTNLENLVIVAANNMGGHGIGNRTDNILTGSEEGDILDGDLGADTMTGGAGNDSYYVDNAGDIVIELAGEGKQDIVFTHVDYSLTVNVENLTLLGNGNLSATGNALDNYITGNDGDNWLDGGAGADTLIGGIGSDTYVLDNPGDLAVEYSDSGIDTIRVGRTFTLDTWFENLTLTGAVAANATGNAVDNVITGNSAVNALYGLAGNDWLDGGAGGDRMEGGAGDDTYIVDDANDRVYDNAGGVNAGTDLVVSSLSWTLGTLLENLTLTGAADLDGTGNGLDNVITGNDGANVLNGLSGNDTLYGLGGDDTLDGGKGHNVLAGGMGDDTCTVDTGDSVVENIGEGHDTVMASVTWSLNFRANFIEDLILTGSTNIDATGNHLDNVITGNRGNNRMDGGFGHDVLTGGLGADTFVFNQTSGVDTIADFSAGDGDTIDIHAYTQGTVKLFRIEQTGGDVTIHLSGSNAITVLGATASDVAAHMNW